MHFLQNATNYHNIIATKLHFIRFNFKRQLNFTNLFNVTVDFVTVWPTSNDVVECLTVLILCHVRLSFDFVPPVWCELELKNQSRRDVLWQTETKFEKPVQKVVGMIRAPVTRTEKSGISLKISRDDETFGRLQNWSCNSSRILTITREIENGFRISTASSCLSSGKYRWNSISRDWRWSTVHIFKLSSLYSVFSTALENFSNIARFPCITLWRQFCNFR